MHHTYSHLDSSISPPIQKLLHVRIRWRRGCSNILQRVSTPVSNGHGRGSRTVASLLTALAYVSGCVTVWTTVPAGAFVMKML